MPITLEVAHKHILRLLARDAGPDGWVPVGAKLYPVLSKIMPPELAEFENAKEGYRARLTEKGRTILEAIEWL